MDIPTAEIHGIVRALCTESLADQQRALDQYFTPDAFFIHPLCRVPSFSTRAFGFELNSLSLLRYIFLWYRFLSPHIDLTVDSAVMDTNNSLLYLTIRQTFTLWFIPFSLWQAHVKLVTVLTLVERPVDSKGSPVTDANGVQVQSVGPNDKSLWFIKGQEDHYQMEEWLKFIAPFGASLLWQAWQLFATYLCWLGVICLWPFAAAVGHLNREGLGSDSRKATKKQ